jgi:ankyrin repeat protein
MRPAFRGAARYGDLERLRALLDTGSDVNVRDRYHQTGLMLAAQGGHTEAVRLLIERGADLDVAAKFSLTALMLAVLGGHAEVVRLLVAAGADLTIRGSGAPGFFNRTALGLARARDDAAITAILKEAGAPE